MWYSQGTITATNNNTVINGVGTDFLQGVRVGDGITIQGSAALHEVMSIASATQMTIRPAYTGATGAGKQYAVAPVLGYDKGLSDAFNQLRLQFGDKLSSLQPWAHAATASAALDALGFSASGKAVATGDPSAALDVLGFGTPEQGRAMLELKSAATKDVGVGDDDVMPVGAGGWLGSAVAYFPPPQVVGTDYNRTCVIRAGAIDYADLPAYSAGLHLTAIESDTWGRIGIGYEGYSKRVVVSGGNMRSGGVGATSWTAALYHTGNTTKNPDGTLKASSPVINLYTDHHDLHNEEQFGGTPVVTRKSKGVYEITGTLGLRSEGWYLDTPNDRNGNKYFNIEWTQNITPTAVDGIVDEYRDDIVVTIETFERVWDKETGIFENGTPIDINELQDRFVQLRFNEIKVEHEELVDESFN